MVCGGLIEKMKSFIRKGFRSRLVKPKVWSHEIPSTDRRFGPRWLFQLDKF